MNRLRNRRIAVAPLSLCLLTGCSDIGFTDSVFTQRPFPTGLSDSGAMYREPAASAASDRRIADGAVELIASFPPGQVPEGVALDHAGNLYVSNRHRDPVSGAFVRNEILRIDVHGQITLIADLGPAPPGRPGILGLATNSQGNILAAFASFDPATSGVYRVERDGSGVNRLPGSENMIFPNGLAFDSFGYLYATDSFAGAVWRFHAGGIFEVWSQSALLAPVAVPGFPPLPGANGIVYQPRRGLFISNSSQGTIVRIPVQETGTPGIPGILASGLLGIDGLTANQQGPLYFVNAGANLLGVPAVGRVNPETGEVNPVTSALMSFDDPTSIALGRGPRFPGSVFVVNANIFPPTGAGAGVVQVGVR